MNQQRLRIIEVAIVTVSPRSPIGYNIDSANTVTSNVAVSPRSPIGYNGTGSPSSSKALRLAPVLPSAIIDSRRLNLEVSTITVFRAGENQPSERQNDADCSGF